MTAKELIRLDRKRYGENIKILDLIFKPYELKWSKLFRMAQAHSSNSILGIYYRVRLRNISRKSQIQIPAKVQIGKGFYIGHTGRIIINQDVCIGDNVNIATGVTIGATNRGSKKGTPTIGNKVWIGTNAVVVGNITVGNNVLIAPNSYVNCDVPDNSIVIGNPAVVRYNINATEGYINKCV